jgi:hypothetical protein
MTQFPKTRLHLVTLQQELVFRERLTKDPGAVSHNKIAEMQMMEQVQAAIDEVEFLLQLAEQHSVSSSERWSSRQYSLILGVMVLSMLLMASGLWAIILR